MLRVWLKLDLLGSDVDCGSSCLWAAAHCTLAVLMKTDAEHDQRNDEEDPAEPSVRIIIYVLVTHNSIAATPAAAASIARYVLPAQV